MVVVGMPVGVRMFVIRALGVGSAEDHRAHHIDDKSDHRDRDGLLEVDRLRLQQPL